MLAIVTMESDRVGRLAYDSTLDLSVKPAGTVTMRSVTPRQKLVCRLMQEFSVVRQVLDPGARAPEQSIAFFSSETGYFGDRCLRLNPAHFERYGITEPAWAKTALHRVAVRGEALWKSSEKFKAGLPEAVRMAVVILNRRQRRLERRQRYDRMPLAIISPASPDFLAVR